MNPPSTAAIAGKTYVDDQDAATLAAAEAYTDAALAPTVDGTLGGQVLADQKFKVVGTTTDAAAVTVNCSYVVTNGHGAAIDGSVTAVDRTAAKIGKKEIVGAVRQFSGTYAVAGFSATTAHSDSSLSTIDCTAVVVGGVLQITFTPPAAYSGTLDWVAALSFSQN